MTTKRLLLLVTSNSYRTPAFGEAATALGIDPVYGWDIPRELAELYGVPLALEFADVEGSTATIVARATETPFDAILAVDDSGSLLAARASAALGLPHNDPASAEAARNKYRMRQMLQAGGVPVPWFRRLPADADLAALADEWAYPVVVKPLLLSGSRGVIRADDPATFVAAAERVRAMLKRIGGTGDHQALLVEAYLPGSEVALEGILVDGALQVLALFDKPDPLEGPFFEETLYVTPSRLSPTQQAAIAARVQEAAAALGLRTGPVHAELRLNERGIWLIEMAGRSIGGLCGSILEFGLNACLEEVIVRQAVGLPLPDLSRRDDAVGVMMIPIPRAGMLRAVRGTEAAKRVAGVTGIEISAPLDYPLAPLPEGESYLGFIFARAATPADVEHALRSAHAALQFEIEDVIPLSLA